MMELKPVLKKLRSTLRAILTFLFALLVLGVMVWAYVAGFQLVTSDFQIVSFGFYGLLLSVHVLAQSIFAFIERRRMKARTDCCTFTKTVGFTISAYQEDPEYLRECLNSIRALQYPPELLRVIMVVDGNKEDDRYMMDMFMEVFADQDPGCYVWKNNYHTWDPAQAELDVEMATGATDGTGQCRPGEDPQRRDVEHLIQTRRCVCIMQKWGGKREVMYTAFKALGPSVDYIQVRVDFLFVLLMVLFWVALLSEDCRFNPPSSGVRLRHQAGPAGHRGTVQSVGEQPQVRRSGRRRDDPQPEGLIHQLHEQPEVLDGLQHRAGLPVVLQLRVLHQRSLR